MWIRHNQSLLHTGKTSLQCFNLGRYVLACLHLKTFNAKPESCSAASMSWTGSRPLRDDPGRKMFSFCITISQYVARTVPTSSLNQTLPCSRLDPCFHRISRPLGVLLTRSSNLEYVKCTSSCSEFPPSEPLSLYLHPSQWYPTKSETVRFQF